MFCCYDAASAPLTPTHISAMRKPFSQILRERWKRMSGELENLRLLGQKAHRLGHGGIGKYFVEVIEILVE